MNIRLVFWRFLAIVVLSAAVHSGHAAGIVTFEAESGTLGSGWAVSNSTSPVYITITSDSTGSNPGSAARVATYNVTFPAADTYQFYARVRVGPNTFNDDSLFYASSFGTKSPTLNSDWIQVNGLGAAGFSNSTEVVTGGGTLGSGMWKWINLSQFAGQPGFTVSAGNLTQTFQIGARENGLDLDGFAFGSAGISFTVSNLDTGTLPGSASLNTNLFVGSDGIALHRFSAVVDGLNQDGANPAAGLAVSGNALVGTTLNGGAHGAGTAFTMALDGTDFSTFRAFTNAPDAGAPQSEFSFSATRFFSATFGGGADGVGAVIAGQTNGSVAVLRSFSAVSADTATNSGGASPTAALALSGGTLFGVATAGGAAGNGTVFSLTTNSTTFSVLHNFNALDYQSGTNTDGAIPMGGLLLAGGTLFGTASSGGAGGSGVVFSVNTNGANFTTLYSFSPMDVLTGTNTDGAIPLGGLVLSGNVLYGTTCAGGFGGRGTVFALQTNGAGFTVLHQFSAVDLVTGTNSDGASSSASLLWSGGVLYGTASAGGTGAAGTVFSVQPDGTQFRTLHSFVALEDNGTNRYGACPVAPLVRLGNSLYGTAFSGGPGAAGTVFAVPIPVPPAVITNVVLHPDGTVTAYFVGAPNTTNIIQTATSLNAPVNWQNIATNVADADGAWQFTENNPTNGAQFYRSYAQ